MLATRPYSCSSLRAAALLAALTLIPGCGDTFQPAADGGGSLPEASLPDDAGAEAAPDLLQPDTLAPDTAPPPPTITSVTDKGKDGTAVVGEEVWLGGTYFGPNCKVVFSAAGKSVEAKVLSQSQTDLRFQTPEGIAVGAHAPDLTCDNGTAAFSLTVIRYHLVTMPDVDRVAVMRELQPGQIEDTKQRLKIDDPDTIALSDDSAVAYVGTARTRVGSPKISMVDLTTGGGPSVLSASVPYSEPVKMPVYGLAVADKAPLLAVAGGLYVLLYDLSDPRAPKKVGKVQFVNVVPNRGVPQINTGYFIDVALSPDGTQAVLLDGAADQINVYDVTTPATPKAGLAKITVSGGSSTKPVVQIPVISGLLGRLKIRGGSAQDLVISPDGKRAMVLAGGGLTALFPESVNLDLNNTTISVVDLTTGAYITKLEYLSKAHFPNNAHFGPDGTGYVTSLSSSSAVLVEVIFQIAVAALLGGGSLDLTDIASLLFKNFLKVIDVIKAIWDGTLFDLGGLNTVVNSKAAQGKFTHISYIQAGMCSTYDNSRLLAAGQGWVVDIKFDFPKVSKFVFKYDLGVTVHDLTQKKHKYHSLQSWKLKMLLPPWAFGNAACQQ